MTHNVSSDNLSRRDRAAGTLEDAIERLVKDEGEWAKLEEEVRSGKIYRSDDYVCKTFARRFIEEVRRLEGKPHHKKAH